MYTTFFKRLIDIIGSLFLIIITLPIMLVIAVAIKLESKGPVFFKQPRSGKDGVFFTFIKFRSMEENNNATDFRYEDKITKVGKFIRNNSIDELPQIFLVLKGDMSFIGPRPWMIEYCEFFTDSQKQRLSVKPGITGLAQCNGRNDLTIIEKINKDIEYVNNITFMNDFKIILKTIKSVIFKDGITSSKYSVKKDIDVLKDQSDNQLLDSWEV